MLSKINTTRQINKANLYFTPSNLQSAMIYGQFKRLNELIQIKKRIMNNYKKFNGTKYSIKRINKFNIRV